jgi:hypothetical protein
MSIIRAEDTELYRHFFAGAANSSRHHDRASV